MFVCMPIYCKHCCQTLIFLSPSLKFLLNLNFNFISSSESRICHKITFFFISLTPSHSLMLPLEKIIFSVQSSFWSLGVQYIDFFVFSTTLYTQCDRWFMLLLFSVFFRAILCCCCLTVCYYVTFNSRCYRVERHKERKKYY